MKNILLITLIFFVFTACNDLDIYPLSEGSSESWNSSEDEFEMSLNNLYLKDFWWFEGERKTDNCMYRSSLYNVTGGTMSSDDGEVSSIWTNSYKAIARANAIIEDINDDAKTSTINEPTINQIEGDARFVRASQYAKLIFLFGDVPYYTEKLSIDEAFALGRTDKDVILQAIYDDYDYAASNLPVSYEGSELKRATRGAALAMKARIALYMGDYETARDAAKAVIDMGEYQLHSDFGDLFLSSTSNSSETIFAIPTSTELGTYFGYYKDFCNYVISRTSGGWGSLTPTWDLFCSYLCTDGLPIDESPLYNPQKPFENRDPRCNATIVEFGTEHLGCIYEPHPDSTEVYSYTLGKYVTNMDTRSNTQYASYAGMTWKKRVDEDWLDDRYASNDIILMRYADILLIYAEAKIELNDIDASVLDAMNQVRARAYGVGPDNTSAYPEITSTDQSKLREILRFERRMEFAFYEGRYFDIIRWKIAEKVLNAPIYVMLDVEELREKVISKGLWFFPGIPEIDEDGFADFAPLYDAGLIKITARRKFPARQYLWPIPSKEIQINTNLEQNTGY